MYKYNFPLVNIEIDVYVNLWANVFNSLNMLAISVATKMLMAATRQDSGKIRNF